MDKFVYVCKRTLGVPATTRLFHYSLFEIMKLMLTLSWVGIETFANYFLCIFLCGTFQRNYESGLPESDHSLYNKNILRIFNTNICDVVFAMQYIFRHKAFDFSWLK